MGEYVSRKSQGEATSGGYVPVSRARVSGDTPANGGEYLVSFHRHRASLGGCESGLFHFVAATEKLPPNLTR